MPDLKDKVAVITGAASGIGHALAARCAREGMVVADHVFQAIVDRHFYILTHPEYTPMIEARMAALVRGRNPVDLQALAGG